jgi:hypothetical protein
MIRRRITTLDSVVSHYSSAWAHYQDKKIINPHDFCGDYVFAWNVRSISEISRGRWVALT